MQLCWSPDFIAVPIQLNKWPCLSLTDSKTPLKTLPQTILTSLDNFLHLHLLRHLQDKDNGNEMHFERRHDMTNKKTMMTIMTMITLRTMRQRWQWHWENTTKEWSQRFVILGTLITFLKIDNNNHKIHSDFREAPLKFMSPLFGHCPNSDCTPRPALKRALGGTFFPGRFEHICQITVLTVHKCTKHPGKP